MGAGGVTGAGAGEVPAAQDKMLLVLAAIGFLYILRLVYLVVPWFYRYFLRPAKDLKRYLPFPSLIIDAPSSLSFFLPCPNTTLSLPLSACWPATLFAICYSIHCPILEIGLHC